MDTYHGHITHFCKHLSGVTKSNRRYIYPLRGFSGMYTQLPHPRYIMVRWYLWSSWYIRRFNILRSYCWTCITFRNRTKYWTSFNTRNKTNESFDQSYRTCLPSCITEVQGFSRRRNHQPLRTSYNSKLNFH